MRSERILLKFLVLWVVIVVEFIIKFFRDYKHNIVTSPEKFKEPGIIPSSSLPSLPEPFSAASMVMPSSTMLFDQKGSMVIGSSAAA